MKAKLSVCLAACFGALKMIKSALKEQFEIVDNDYSLSCQEVEKKNHTTLMPVC